MDMKDMPAALRPREKLLAQGPAALADAELLALLLRTGIQGKGVLVMAGELLASFDGFGGLLQASADDFRRVKGLGPAKRAELAAVMEMARRALLQPMQRGPVFDSPGRVKDFVSLQLARREQEVFGVLFLDSQHRLIEWRELFQGTLSQTSVYPREIVKLALALNAGALILAHNHPSGLAEPSKADEYLTQSLKAALQMVDVRVLDHLVVGAGQVVSFAERGLI
ncbi:DNA repair protein RadC [Ideonella azotifigens]|uniref:DNA repair protein RadC n=1 Tax=Ideonella azotifigens TaxID=513160 RepID=A0ABN1JYA8_9BURK|nr:DNA repair protein RadC [Ideonella azotifigens]MCD2341457.1 DNA repair protein RadC [Ideonella azotifigens]